MEPRTIRLCRGLVALAVAAIASVVSAQNQTFTIPAPIPQFDAPQFVFDPPRMPNKQNVAYTIGQGAASTSVRLASHDAAKSVEPNGKRRAVLFAVGEFNDSKHLPSLPGTRNDMALIYERLTAQGDISNEQIVVLADGDGSEFAPDVKRVEPTCANFIKTVTELAAAQAENDVLFIFVSTHGGSRSAEKDAKTGRSFICPKDAIFPTNKVGAAGETEDEFARLAETNNLIPTLKLLRELQSSKGKVVAIIDACQKEVGAEAWSFNSEFDEWTKELREESESAARQSGAVRIAYADSNITVVTACSSRQTTREITVDGKTFGAFSYAFAEGLAGAADRYGAIDGKIKLLEAYNYASGKTRRLTNGKQVPSISEAADAYKIVVTTAPKNPNLSSETAKLYEAAKSLDDSASIAKVADNLSKLSQFIYIEPDDVDVNYLTGYALRWAGSTIKKARGPAWIAALQCFDRAGEELTLFVDGRYDSASSKGCLLYRTPNAKREDHLKEWIKHGGAVVIDRIEKVSLEGKTEYRARIARLLDMPEDDPCCDYWVSCSSLNWDRALAETVVTSRAPNIVPNVQPAVAPIGTPGNSSFGVDNMPRPVINL